MIAFPKIAALPPEARLWLYAASRPLSAAEETTVLQALDRFLVDWSSHGRPVIGAAEVAEHRIVGIGGLIPSADISGCGIDKSVHLLDEVASAMGIEWLGGLAVAYRDTAGQVQVAHRPEFRKLVRQAAVGPGTPVIDLATDTVSGLASVERPAASSWHGQVFGLLPDPVST